MAAVKREKRARGAKGRPSAERRAHVRQLRKQRAWYGPGSELRRDRELDQRNQEIAEKIRKDHLHEMPLGDALMVAMRLVDLIRKDFCGERQRKVMGPEELREIQRKLLGRPEPSRACKVHCGEPAGDGWADDE